MGNMHKNNNPALRFPEFQNEWEEKSLGEFMSFKNGINADKSQYGHGRKFINVLDIIADRPIYHDKIIGFVDVPDKEFEKNEVVFGDILFQRSSETREDAGQSNIYLDKNMSATFGGFVIRGRPTTKFNPIYFDFLLKTKSARKEITTKSGGSTRFNVGQESLASVKVRLSLNEEEQVKIASFLSSIDDKLNKLRRKRQLLETYKRGLMRKIFSQAVRFKRDDGSYFPDWKNAKLGELCAITTGKLDANAMIENGEYRFYTCAKEYYQINTFAFDTEALLISGNGANVGYIHYYKGKFNAYQRTYVLDAFSENIFYINQFLIQNLSMRIDREKKAGNTPYIVMGTLSEMTIGVPDPQEQKKIADFLDAFDNKIDVVGRHISELEAFRQGLLQKMFV